MFKCADEATYSKDKTDPPVKTAPCASTIVRLILTFTVRPDTTGSYKQTCAYVMTVSVKLNLLFMPLPAFDLFSEQIWKKTDSFVWFSYRVTTSVLQFNSLLHRYS